MTLYANHNPPSDGNLFTDLTILIPVNVLNNRPVPSSMSDTFSEEVNRNSTQEYGCRNASHGAIRIDISDFCDPRICVEREEESKAGLERHGSDSDFSSDRSVAINGIDKGDVGCLDDGEVHWILLDRQNIK